MGSASSPLTTRSRTWSPQPDPQLCDGPLDELALAYAATIHKAQGSEYPAVVIPLTTQHYAMLARNLLYTGVTRGRRLVVLVGQKRALGIAVRNGAARRRWTRLREWLAGRTGAAPAPGTEAGLGHAPEGTGSVPVTG